MSEHARTETEFYAHDPSKRYDWTQAVCRKCWNEHNPERQVTNAATVYTGELCCYCGEESTSGIYLRVDPATVPFPAEKFIG